MVLSHIFSKSPDKNKDKDKHKDRVKDDKERRGSSDRPPLRSISVRDVPDPRSPNGSPKNPSTSTAPPPRKSPTKSHRSRRDLEQQPSRSHTTTARYHHRFSSSSRYSHDPDSHPLNLPPDELHRRLTVMAAAREEMRSSSMDIDQESPSSPHVPVPHASQQQKPVHNGANHGNSERSPTPPPHRSSPSVTDGESFKLAGNKFFKAGDYNRAIQEYNKGLFSCFSGNDDDEILTLLRSVQPSRSTPTRPHTSPTALPLICPHTGTWKPWKMPSVRTSSTQPTPRSCTVWPGY